MNLFFYAELCRLFMNKKVNETKYVYINIFSFYHNHYVVDDELQKLWVIYDAYFICVLA